ncbi:sporulation histidine kinase inhibitor Sda [Paenibacillus radicis (ex Xue et al. 2023)]|uniref:Sporulation histidine kinase inhibitor Sda n=1 Tax=Paenibacillus radicis (ex Xue et al. 2023) TaxID=2972489 RepID=A0ABT1YTB1_9BACL|nr:sporulation histidine kinase inhibitor Sda [Paenibacillus radicis (ex Xue et al. 2023)]MCR8636424.1 sporulation histidine kinase inhibitor Sda [Paenibacillus radicis (ex Xue et al. 2023)]
MYDSLKDTDLVNSYVNAVGMKLDQDFIDMLFAELKRRKLQIIAKQSFTSSTPNDKSYIQPSEGEKS